MQTEVSLRHKIHNALISLMESGIPRVMSLNAKHSAKYRHNKNYPFHKNVKFENADLEEISSEEVNIPKEYIHDRLNPQIWKDDKLRPEVRKQMIKIAKEFYTSLELVAEIKDIKFIGSMANFNWSSQSDLDIHLFFDFSEINTDTELVKNYFNAQKTLWNDKHSIKIKGFDTEVYCNDINDNYFSAGVYSLVQNEWLSKPSVDDFKIDRTAVINKIVSLINQIEHWEQSKGSAESLYEAGEILKARIKKMRQCGLEEGGEFSVENLAFKYLRNNGYLERLFEKTRQEYDKSLSLS